MIAQRLKERYGEALDFWKYEVQWYEQYLSSVRLSESRIKKLEHVYMQELQGIKEGIQKRKLSGLSGGYAASLSGMISWKSETFVGLSMDSPI